MDNYLKTIGATTVSFKAGELEVSNGRLLRGWRLTQDGLLTTRICDLTSGRKWGGLESNLTCDWALPTGAGDICPGKLLSIEADLSDDEGFTAEHVRVECKFFYEQVHLELLYIVWIYPDFAGMRTQFKVKYSDKAGCADIRQQQGRPTPRRVDSLPIQLDGLRRRYFGYYSDTQNRNDPFLDILKEETVSHPLKSPEWITWANAVCLEEGTQGIAMVKESHKCVNHAGHDSGMFIASPEQGILNLGWGIFAHEIPHESYVESWASWLFCWNETNVDRETAYKKFDRLRYPVNIERDTYIQANTWGSSSTTGDARSAAREESVLQEIECCADIGIDVLQIDDGWQSPSETDWDPGEAGWHPHPSKYPGGWGNIVESAKKTGVRLGLWAAAEPITLEELVENHEAGGFVQYKLDFAHLDSRKRIHELMDKARKFILSADHQARVNWDLTEINPRYGYFFAREYGTIYLENRKPVKPFSAIYRPATVLRDLWQISKYINLNKFQASYQNIDMVDTSMSNANYYNHAYCFAITMMGTPLFFLETKYLSESAKKELRPLIKAYKKVQKDIFGGCVYPIGDKPNDAAWSGFQSRNHENGNGYLTIFRELNNTFPEKEITLRYLAPKTKIKLKNLLTGEEQVVCLSEKQQVALSIPKAPGFLFLRYEKE
jgi:hypothetical protein